MKSRITKSIAMLAILCVLMMALAAPAFAASYSRVYGQTQDRVRVRASASSSATVIDNIVKGACVYVTDTKTSGGSTFVKVNYRNSDGDIDNGWVCHDNGKETYVKILSAAQAESIFSVKDGKLPSKKVGTFSAAERKSAQGSATSSSGGSTGTDTIKSVQTMLKALGYYSGEITGNVGSKTETAIKKFQKEYDLTADGVAGPNTVARLKAVYADKGGSTSSTSSSGSSLKLGSSGTKVRDLQQDLTTLGYYWAEITGSYGSKTEAAVKSFQKKNNLTADGVAGSKTLSAIASAVERKGGSSSGSGYASGTYMKLNSQGATVTQLQTDLKQLGYYYGSITGNFGEKTEQAVKDFQKAKGLTADGVAGGSTLTALEKAIAAAGGSTSSSTTGLKVGSTGDKVSELQEDLTALGYYYGDISGHYGSLTQAAVKKFQKAKGINQDGIAGTTTLNAIASALGGGSGSSGSKSLREGSSGSDVKELQTMLKELSYYSGSLSGNFGSLTARAVRKFQEDNNLTVDGIAGSKTLNLLRSKTNRPSSGSSSGSGSITSSSVAEDDSYFLINKDGVRLRTTYSLTSAAKTTVDKGHPVQANRRYNVGGTIWYNITLKNNGKVYTGYVRGQVLNNVSRDTFVSNGGNVDMDAPVDEIMGMIRITGDNVSIREEADSGSAKVASANRGDLFYYVNKSGNWYQIQSGYWVNGDYAKTLSDSEIKDYVNSGDYSGETYREGDTGTMVSWIQEALNLLGYYDGKISGNYGRLTKEAVRVFQKENGLGADGVAGPKTIALLMQKASEKNAAGSGNATYKPVIYNVEWFVNKDNINAAGLKAGKNATMIDIATGRTMKIRVQSTGNHIDAEPLTASDSKVLCGLYGFTSPSQMTSSNSWMRRYVVVQAENGEQFVGSIYAVPHGRSTISGNDFNGQFCIHLRGSTVHAGDGGSVPESKNHQAVIAQGVKVLEAKKNADGSKVTSISETYPSK